MAPSPSTLLRRWLDLEGYGGKRRLARHLDVGESTVGAWLQGDRRPSLDLAAALEDLTGGVVPALSWADQARLEQVRDRARATIDTAGVD